MIHFSDLLTICIPTFNREKLLRETLSALLKQTEPLGIKVIISDNGSTDSTVELVRELQKDNSHILLKESPSNKGFDANHLKVISCVDTPFAWLLGDDDVVMEDAVERVLNRIRDDLTVELLLLNAYVVDVNSAKLKKHLDVKSDLEFTNCKKFLEFAWDKLSFGALVIRADLFKKLHALEKYEGTCHLYSGGVYEYLAQSFVEKKRNNIKVLCDIFVCLKRPISIPTSVQYAEMSTAGISQYYMALPEIYSDLASSLLKKISGQVSFLFFILILKMNQKLADGSFYEKVVRYLPGGRVRIVHFIKKMPISLSRITVSALLFSNKLLRFYRKKRMNFIER